MIITVTGLVTLINEGVVAATKRRNTFVTNVTLPFTLSVSKYFIKNNFMLWFTCTKIFNKTLRFVTIFTKITNFLLLFYFIILLYFLQLNHNNKCHQSSILLQEPLNIVWSFKHQRRFVCVSIFPNINLQILLLLILHAF